MERPDRLVPFYAFVVRTDHSLEAGLLVAYTAAMFILYTTAPVIYRLAGSVFFNLSLLSANFFGLLFGK